MSKDCDLVKAGVEAPTGGDGLGSGTRCTGEAVEVDTEPKRVAICPHIFVTTAAEQSVTLIASFEL